MVNGYSDNRKYIPMGTFGLCDFLWQRGFESKIFNAALYDENKYWPKLKLILKNYRPDYVGLIIHWKELLKNCLSLSSEIKNSFPNIKIVARGITAGFLYEELLKKFKTIDFVIKGDPEKPLCMILAQKDLAKVPNLAYRRNSKIIKNHTPYSIDKKTLNSLSYTKLNYLIDHNKYIQKINDVLGFPIFIGRGCIYNCPSCGGSKKAFRTHSNRQHIVCRDITAVVEDLKQLLEYTDNIHICYEVDLKYIHNLFKAIRADNKISKKFRLNYGAWHLMDIELIDLYSKAFKFAPGKRSIIELTPETSLNKDRRHVRDRSLYFSNRQMLRCIKSIQQKLNTSITIHIYYGRYHKTHKDFKKLMIELENIHKLRKYFYNHEENNITIYFKHLATDVGSCYWDSAIADHRESDSIDLLLSFIERSKSSHPNSFMMDNICIYSPKQLNEHAMLRYEIILAWVNLILNEIPGYYFNITKVLGFSKFIKLLRSLADEYIFLK